MTIQEAHAQSRETAFGLIREIPTEGKYDRISLIENKKTGDYQLLLWSARSTKLVLAAIDSGCVKLNVAEYVLPMPFDDVLSADVTGEEKPDLVVVHRALGRISIITDLLPDSLRIATSLSIPFAPTTLVLGDINNDRRTDILVFSREQPGILPFLGLGRGQFKQAPLIAPDNAAANLALVQLNNDNLTDIVLYDWVKSELHLLYGVGQGKFIDQTTFPVDGDLRFLIAEEMSKGKGLNFLLSYKTPPQIQLWSGDGLGYFRPTFTSKLRSPATALLTGDLNNDGWKDVALLQAPAALQVHLSLGEELSPDFLEFAIPSESRNVILRDVNADGKIDALMLDRDGGKLLIYFNAEQTNMLVDSLEFVTGLRPMGLAIADVNGDGEKDVALVNAGSNSLSIFYGRGQAGLNGQTTFTLPASPRYAHFHSAVDSTARFLISYPTESSVSLWTLNLRDNSTVNAIIPTAGESELLFWGSSEHDQINFFAYNSVTPVTAPSLAFFQQLGPQTFIERSFHLTIPDVLLGAAVEDLNNDGYVDVAYAYRNVSTGKYELGVSLGDSSMSYTRKVFSYTLPDSVLKKSYFWIKDFDHDGTLDLLFLFPLTSRQLSVARGLGNGTFAPPAVVAEKISVSDRAQVRILDLNGDGIPDVAINDAEGGALGWLRGKGDCTFEDWHTLIGGARIGHFAFGDLNDDGVLDLVVSLTDKGTMNVYNGRLFFKALTQKLEN